jgi:hypothetical protein
VELGVSVTDAVGVGVLAVGVAVADGVIVLVDVD